MKLNGSNSNAAWKSQHRHHQSLGFTLAELMVTIAVIMLLFIMLAQGLFTAQETARRARTQQIITRLHDVVMGRFESYQLRRLPIDPAAGVSPTVSNYRNQVARNKLGATRELMRMELPNNYSDLAFSPLYLKMPGSSTPFRSSLASTYLYQLGALVGTASTSVAQQFSSLSANYQEAELLYVTLAFGTDDRDTVASLIGLNDLSDADADKVPEISDAWGHPICWFRWPAGFYSDLQPVYSLTNDGRINGVKQQAWPLTPCADPLNKGFVLTRDPVRNHDAFDPFNIDQWEPAKNGSSPEIGFNVFPLIVSAGPDYDPLTGGGFGLQFDNISSSGASNTSDPFNTSNMSSPFYIVKGSNNISAMRAAIVDDSAYNNVHSHMLGARK